jgi:hypothetical protein
MEETLFRIHAMLEVILRNSGNGTGTGHGKRSYMEEILRVG